MRILVILVLLACCVIGVFYYLSYKMFNPPWTNEATLVGPDGYTYYFMNYSMLQAQIMRLSRTSDTSAPVSKYEILGEAYGDSPRIWASIIRPEGASDDDYGLLYLTDQGVILGFRYRQSCYFAYDIKEGTFFRGEAILNFSPYLLIQKNTVLHEKDVYATILQVAKSIHENYLFPGCPRRDVLSSNINHPNERVRIINKWLMEIHDKGLSTPTDTIHELLDYVFKGLESENKILRLNAIEICGYFQIPYIEKAIPFLEKTVCDKGEGESSEAAMSLGRLGERAFPVLLNFLKSPDSSIQFCGLLGFRSAGPNAKFMVKEIVPLLKDKNSNVRFQAVNALEEIKYVDVELLPLYEELSNSREKRVRDYACTAISQIKGGR